MKKTAFVLGLLLSTRLYAQTAQTWRAAGFDGSVVVLPGGCTSTWYDPEVFIYPDSSRGFLAQGAMANPCTANVGLDSLFRAKRDSVSGAWQLPTANSCPTLVGAYASTACPGQGYFAPHQPLASPAIAQVGNKYYMAFSGGNGDYRKGNVFWASSNDGVNWSTFKWDPKPPGYNWKPLIYPKYGDFCETFGISQLTLTYDPSTEYGSQGAFYIHFNYIHRTGELDAYTFRFRISFNSGNTRSNNAAIALASDGTGSLAGYPSLEAAGQIDIVGDVNGYFK
jgi:hypothetical protein